MRSFITLFSVVLIAATGAYIFSVNSDESLDANLITNCDGTQFIRTSPGEIRVQTVPKNLPGCIGMAATGASTQNSTGVTILLVIRDVTNCNGLRVISYSDESYKSFYVEKNLPNCVRAAYVPPADTGSHIDLSHGPLLDLASTDIVNYQTKKLKDQGIRFANAVRSARIRRAATKNSNTEAILMRNDAVVVSGEVSGWTKVSGADLEVTNQYENTIGADTSGKASGYTAGRLLRDPNASDLVTIEQADHAYWSDIAYTNTEKYVNVRSNPNYKAPIVTTLGRDYPLYIISTIDNWSLVRNDSGSIKGYVRSDLLRVVRIQRVDTSKGVK
ncbi:SH3 domain-containing protein [Candidatus Gracilibacteria bacterium]|nr:SH3 domain-containing protein [Candidatus Gracilibacteria bacterium]